MACCEWEEINLPVSPRTTHFRLYMIDNWGASWFSIEQAQLRIAGRCNGNSCSEDQFFNKHLCYFGVVSTSIKNFINFKSICTAHMDTFT